MSYNSFGLVSCSDRFTLSTDTFLFLIAQLLQFLFLFSTSEINYCYSLAAQAEGELLHSVSSASCEDRKHSKQKVQSFVFCCLDTLCSLQCSLGQVGLLTGPEMTFVKFVAAFCFFRRFFLCYHSKQQSVSGRTPCTCANNFPTTRGEAEKPN